MGRNFICLIQHLETRVDLFQLEATPGSARRRDQTCSSSRQCLKLALPRAGTPAPTRRRVPVQGTSCQLKPKRRFRFEAAWVSSPECAEVIENAWGGFVADNPGKSVLDKIRATRVSLLQWNSSSFGNIRQTVKTIDAKICCLSLLPITTDRKAEIGRLRDKLEVWLWKEEILWKQGAKAHWLAAGDRNTSFFHSKANERRIHKEIKRIKDDKGEEVTSKKGIQ
ncbi:UNVERIFIED_CONTAM: hypothetical protein Slati_0980700 [Sesamum latifolium]|uniref:Uncharacterized protein n=1 Tax=Sesamum latifolium TaxID=2727402 RepID=A0AAW2XQW8_9LAMI